MVSRFFFMVVTMTDLHPCLQIWKNIALTSGNQFKPNWARVKTFHQNFNSLFSIKLFLLQISNVMNLNFVRFYIINKFLVYEK